MRDILVNKLVTFPFSISYFSVLHHHKIQQAQLEGRTSFRLEASEGLRTLQRKQSQRSRCGIESMISSHVLDDRKHQGQTGTRCLTFMGLSLMTYFQQASLVSNSSTTSEFYTSWRPSIQNTGLWVMVRHQTTQGLYCPTVSSQLCHPLPTVPRNTM